MFQDRIDAGVQLTKKLSRFQDRDDVVIIGLPRGGVPVAYEISERLELPLDVVCPRKIGAPKNKEFAIGAITETGEGIFDRNTIAQLQIPPEYIEKEIAAEQKEAMHRLDAYRKGLPPRNLRGKTVIIIDDGLATGSTMKAAINSVRSEGADEVIVAIPVAPQDSLDEIEAIADEVICLNIPPFFQAVGQFYQDFSPTTDEEVIELIGLSRSI